MKRSWWGTVAIIFATMLSLPASAIETAPSVPNRVAGPFLITGYSFTGTKLRYVQVYNNSSNLASLDGWGIASHSKAPVVTSTYIRLTGLIEPGDHIFAAIPGLVDRTSFELPDVPTGLSANMGSVSLVAPAASGFNDETVSVPTITTSTLKETDGTSSNYYLRRDISSSTGNYISGFGFILPSEVMKNDRLYTAPTDASLRIVELYTDAGGCSPLESAAICADYVKLFNPGPDPIDMSKYRLRTGTYGQVSSGTNTEPLSGALPAGRYVAVPLSLSSSASWVWLEDMYGSVAYERSLVAFPSASSHDGEAWSYDNLTSQWRWTSIATPFDGPNEFPVLPPVNSCSGLRLSELGANLETDDQFIELYNPSSSAIDVTGCALQTNRSSVASFVLGRGLLDPGKFITVYVKDTGLTLTKTTSGTVYVLSSDLKDEADSATYDDLKEGTSNALIDGIWKQTYLPTAGTTNVWLEYPSCADGYVRNLETGNCNKQESTAGALDDCGLGKYRSPDTNRCRSLEALATALTPCDSGQYRNPETNRCRSLVSTASLLTPCGSGQERNPDTNRCRNSTVTENGLQPCAANQERNPQTNRCRAIAMGTTADFPVEAVAQGSQATLGWWAFGGVGLLAVGYAGWEWRYELLATIRRMASFAKPGR